MPTPDNTPNRTTGAKSLEQLDGAAGSLTDRIADVAEDAAARAKDFGQALPSQARDLSEGVADRLREGAEYLRSGQWRDVADDATRLIRRNPGASLLIAVGIGFLIGRTVSRG